MKITLELPDTMVCAVVTGVVQHSFYNMELRSFTLDSDDLMDGNTISKLKTEETE